MKNLHILPTDKPSTFTFRKDSNYFRFRKDEFVNNDTYQNQHIYITSDEEIKEGDWVLSENKLYQIKESAKDFLNHVQGISKKIILTTDQDLIKDGVQSIDDEFLEWFVKNPSCESLQYYTVSSNTISTTITRYKIIIPQEEPKQENCCPKCGELENFHYNYDYSKVEKVHILDILCNECGELFPPILKIPKQKVMKTAMQELIDWATSLQYNQQQCIDWITIKNKAEQLLEKEEPKQYPIGGYAPGFYSCTCITCKQPFMGDKRAVQCESCAIETAQESKEEAPEKTKGLVYWKANAEEDYVKVPISVLRYIAELESRMYSETIEFAEWIRSKDFQTASKNRWIGLDMKYYTTEELFEQFKKNQDE
jgi:hypothetical protein